MLRAVKVMTNLSDLLLAKALKLNWAGTASVVGLKQLFVTRTFELHTFTNSFESICSTVLLASYSLWLARHQVSRPKGYLRTN